MSKQTSNNPFGSWKVILLLIIAGTAVLSLSPVSADTGVTIAAVGDQSYSLGEKVVFTGHNYDSDSTYLFITGPNLPAAGVKLTSPDKAVVSGNPDSFTVVKTKPDKTWEYSYYTANLPFDAGTYTIYAVSQPETKDQFNNLTTHVTVSIILKKPFITAEISPATVSMGVPITVSGFAEGIPETVRIWVLGKNYYSVATEPVNPDASYTYEFPQEVTSHLDSGQYFVIVQHPMADNQFDFVVSGDYVRNLKLNNGTNIFRINGPGSLQGSDAADALIFAISDQEANDPTYTNDTYAIVPFQVTGPVPADKGVTIAAVGDQSYSLGEKVVLTGHNCDSDSTYLFITGPNLPASGVKLTSPDKAVVSGNPDSCTVVKTKPDKTWEYSYYTANLPFDAGTYTIYAVSQPKAKDQPGTDIANVSIILKKPFVTVNISSSDVVKGQSFSVTGTAEGTPPEVRLWFIGDNYAYTTKTPVNSDALFTFNADAVMSGKLPAGQNYLIVQHPMADNQFDFVVSGDYVRNLKLNNGTIVFKLTGPGSLQGGDAADALIFAISDQEANDHTLTNDMYAIVPFQVTDTGSPTTKYAPLQYALGRFRAFFNR